MNIQFIVGLAIFLFPAICFIIFIGKTKGWADVIAFFMVTLLMAAVVGCIVGGLKLMKDSMQPKAPTCEKAEVSQ